MKVFEFLFRSYDLMKLPLAFFCFQKNVLQFTLVFIEYFSLFAIEIFFEAILFDGESGFFRLQRESFSFKISFLLEQRKAKVFILLGGA